VWGDIERHSDGHFAWVYLHKQEDKALEAIEAKRIYEEPLGL
jgi:hypothetical protein